jgi:pyruvate/2-oxoglutarate/acetoin dehydrogenase E1 component
VASKDSPVAYSAVLENKLLVQTGWIEKAVQELIEF